MFRAQMKRAALSLLSLSLAVTGCGGTEEELAPEPQADGRAESALATLEYQVTVVNSAGYAQSGPNAEGYDSRGWAYGQAWWKQGSDAFLVEDQQSDGRSPGVYWWLDNGSRRGLCRLTTGSTTFGICEKGLPEGAVVHMRMGRCDGDTTDCTKWSNYTNVGAIVTFTNN
ncbi:hypothetical protein [Archangium lansingense]|uniref:Lipoprotein n=1 Tax=Archangium lansingense TaxID=2995310 RepID=A0ABT4AJB7_9BACT|nr:hypothetical protein [Archangium lansinium]MCY1081793.1 hypothetical protein [Archangium lansinium]